MKFCFLDLETTGLEHTKDSIIEASFVVFENNKKISEFDKVLIPEHTPLTDFVTHLTGITQEEIDEKGERILDVKSEIEEKISDSIIVGHNIDFDINFLVSHGVDISKNPRIDTHELARVLMLQEESFALEVLCQKYGFIHENAHRAMSDVLACKSLFELLLKKIELLPQDFLDKIKNFLETKTDWDAKVLFLNPQKSDFPVEKLEVETTQAKNNLDSENKTDFLKDFDLDVENQFVRLGDIQKSVDFYKQGTLALVAKKEKSIIITPKLKFFKDLKSFPTPYVIFDPENLQSFSDRREKLDDQEATFYVKCFYRDFLGHRGLDFFDLFFKENDFWKEVHTDLNSDIYQNILKEKSVEDILVITPKAFGEFITLDIFKERKLWIDESERFIKEVLFAPVKTLSFKKYLNSTDEDLATKAQFFITRFCKEVVEIQLGREIGPFPEKVLFKPHDLYPNYISELEEILTDEDKILAEKVLNNPPEKSVRWCKYHSRSGDLELALWEPEDWRKIKQNLGNFKKIIGYRGSYDLPDDSFFGLFLGTGKHPVSDIKSLEVKRIKHVPDRLVSVKSPDFNNFSAEKIWELFSQQEGNMAVNFSSLDSLRKVFDVLVEKSKEDENIFISGERVMGGAGKMLDKMRQNKDKKILFLFKDMIQPELHAFGFKSLVVQKFPFDAPEPLLDKIQDLVSQKGENFFGIWVMNQVGATLDMKINSLPEVEKVYILDARENARWGKMILENIFPKEF